MEPDINKHHMFETYAEAYEFWVNLSEDLRDKIDPPRQSHNCWIVDKEIPQWRL